MQMLLCISKLTELKIEFSRSLMLLPTECMLQEIVACSQADGDIIFGTG